MRSPFTNTASGSSAVISAIAPAFITAGYGSAPGAGVQDRAELLGRTEAAALDLAEVHVVDGCEGRETPAPGLGERRDRPGEQVGRLHTVDAEVVLRLGIEAGRRAPSGTAPPS